MRFKELRRRRRQPRAPMFLLELDLPFDEVMADLHFPWADPLSGGAFNEAPLSRPA